MRHRRIKILLLSLFIGCSVFLLVSENRTIQTTHANTVLAASYTGAPGEVITCATSSCHGATLNSGAGTLKLQVCPPGPYEPGKTYTLTVSQSNPDANRRRWGFQLTALTAQNRGAGTLNPGALTKKVNGTDSFLLDRQYIEHDETDVGTFRGQNSARWSFNWTAPNTSTGAVTFYIAGAQCDNNGTATGDEIYTTAVTLFPKMANAPVITEATVAGKKLNVLGSGFVEGAIVYVDDKKQKTSFSSDTKLVAKKAGNKVTAGSLIKVVIPEVTQSNEFRFGSVAFRCPADLTLTPAAGQTTATLNYSVPTAGDDGCSSGGTVTCTPPPGSQIALGTTRVICTTSGGTSCSFLATVGGCAIICPADITRTATAAQVVTYSQPTTTGGCGAVTCAPPSGSTFNLGTTAVTCSEAGGARCSFNVTLNAAQPCVLTCADNITLTGGAQVVTYASPITIGNCGVVSCNPLSGSTFQVGTTTVTCSEGGAVRCSFTITISPPQNCALSCPGNITVSLNAGETSRTVSYPPPGTSGACGAVTCTPPSGAVFSVGTTTVSCASLVSNGNCGFSITVLPPAQPCTLTCPANVSVTIPVGQTSTTVNYPAPTTSGDCGTVVCNPPAGSTFSVGTTTVTCTAIGGAPSCSFTVTVSASPPQPCTLTCPANIVVTIPAGQTSTPVVYPPPTTTGDCGTVTCAPPSGSQFLVGITPVFCNTASGGSTCSFTIRVQNASASLGNGKSLIRNDKQRFASAWFRNAG